jgi:hypothetical protein
MQLHRVDTTVAQDVRRFVAFPFTLYRECPQWVPPLLSEGQAILNRQKHPFYDHSEAEFFVVTAGNTVLGRIAALENRNYNAFRGSRTAFFGYFDSVEDREVACRLFEAVFDWAKKRGLNNIIGLRGVIGIDGSALIEGFEHRPALAVPYNYPYYDSLISHAGLVKLTDLLSGYLNRNRERPDRLLNIAEKVKARGRFWVKSFRSKAEIRRWIPKVMVVHRAAFSQTASFYPPTQGEVEHVIGTALTIIDPRMVKLVMKGDEIAGFILAYGDISAGLQRANGRLFPFGWFHILRERGRTNWLNINGLGMLPQYQGLGGNAVLYTELAHTVKQSRFEYVEVIQVDEANFKSRSDMETLGVAWYKRHRHYHCSL